jgi:hypothetical protein
VAGAPVCAVEEACISWGMVAPAGLPPLGPGLQQLPQQLVRELHRQAAVGRQLVQQPLQALQHQQLQLHLQWQARHLL